MTEIAEPITPTTETVEQNPASNPLDRLFKKKKEIISETAEQPIETPIDDPAETPINTPDPEQKLVDTESNTNDVSAKEKLKNTLGVKKQKGAQKTETQVKKPDLPKEWQSEVELLRRENEAMKAELEMPLMTLARTALKENKSLLQIAEELKGVDPDKTPAQELFKIKLDRLGITDPQEVEQELLIFSEKTKSDQLESVMNIREQLRKENNERQNQYVSTSQLNAKKTESEFTSAITGYNEHLKSTIGKTHMGVLITPEIAKNLGELTVWAQNDKQEVSPEELFNLNLFHKYGQLIIDSLVDNSFAAGAEFKDEKLTNTGTAKKISPMPHKQMTEDQLTGQKKVDSIKSAVKHLNSI